MIQIKIHCKVLGRKLIRTKRRVLIILAPDAPVQSIWALVQLIVPPGENTVWHPVSPSSSISHLFHPSQLPPFLTSPLHIPLSPICQIA